MGHRCQCRPILFRCGSDRFPRCCSGSRYLARESCAQVVADQRVTGNGLARSDSGRAWGGGVARFERRPRLQFAERRDGPAQTVVAVTLDWMLERFPAPQIVKMDVEGMEYEALKGAQKLLRTKPTILCEVTQNHEQVGELLRGAGYTLFAARVPERRPIWRPSIETLAVAEGVEVPVAR